MASYHANISPIFKKGDRHTAANYRPVSLTCVFCKMLEHIICRHIMNHLEHYKILTNLQHGFRCGHSCESQLIISFISSPRYQHLFYLLTLLTLSIALYKLISPTFFMLLLFHLTPFSSWYIPEHHLMLSSEV